MGSVLEVGEGGRAEILNAELEKRPDYLLPPSIPVISHARRLNRTILRRGCNNLDASDCKAWAW